MTHCPLCGKKQRAESKRPTCKWCFKGGTGDPPCPEMKAWGLWQRGMRETLRAKLMASGFDAFEASNVIVAVFLDKGSVPPKALLFAQPYLDRATSVGRYDDALKQAMLGRTIAVQLHRLDPSAAHDAGKTLYIDVLSMFTADVITKLRRAGVTAEKRHALEIFTMARDALEGVKIRRGFTWIKKLADRVVQAEIERQSRRVRISAPEPVAAAPCDEYAISELAEFEAAEAEALVPQLRARI